MYFERTRILKDRSVIRPPPFRYKAIGGLIRKIGPCIVASTRFFKTPNGCISDTRPWTYNRGNTVQ